MTEQEILKALKLDPDKAMAALFDQYYGFLCQVAYRMLSRPEDAEDVVQELFAEIWRKREHLNITSSLKSYLHRTTINRTLNFLRKKQLARGDDEMMTQIPADEGQNVQVGMEAEELQQLINDSIANLPPKCQLVFVLIRYENLSYKEVAQTLEISVKTVENQMSRALKILRAAIAEGAKK